jgi:hypothetical protein
MKKDAFLISEKRPMKSFLSKYNDEKKGSQINKHDAYPSFFNFSSDLSDNVTNRLLIIFLMN